MAAKRLFEESARNSDELEGKRKRTKPSLAAVIGEAVMMKSLQNFCSALEPLLRTVVNEEVEHGLRRSARLVSRSPSLRIRAPEPTTLTLTFSKRLSLPVFTGSKIEDLDNNPLKILVIDSRGDQRAPVSLPYPIKVEIMVIDGDFTSRDGEDWTSEQFNNKIVRERTGKRPLLTGDVLVTVRDGFALIGDLSFTDNSSWIRSRTFRLGARVAPGSCQDAKIREAITEPFVVKDHRGELYKKHHPPSLEDEVWRLERIGKDGAFHKKLTSAGINTVQDFLKLWVVDIVGLRKILGGGMSDKMWEATIKHAKTCVMGNKLYKFVHSHCTVVLNPVCQVVGIIINGQMCPLRDLAGVNRIHIDKLSRDAYTHWNSLVEVDEVLSENAMLPSDDEELQCFNHHQNIAGSNPHGGLLTDAFAEVASLRANAQVEYSDWPQNPTFFSAPIENGCVYNMPDSSSDGDSTPSRAFFG